MKNLYKLIFLIVINISPLFAQQITINGIRDFTINPDTIITVDGTPVIQNRIDIFGTGGFKTKFRVANTDVNPTMSQGTLLEINFISDIKGPITSISPLRILDQDVFTTADTILENLSSVDTLIIGDTVSVSGAINEVDNSIQLSRLELETSLSEWTLRGFARGITATTFSIGNLSINNNGITPNDCTNGFINNTFVEIKATVDTNYVAGSPLTTLTSIQCKTPDVDEGSVGVIPTVVEGVISNLIDLSSFKINDLTIFFDNNTSFDNGEAEHLDEGTKVEVQGFIDTDTRFITATTIRFVDHRAKLIAPVNPSDITLNQSITLFGKTIIITPQTRDDDNIISNGLLSQRQIEVRGFTDSEGNVFAQRVKDKGSPDANDTKLRGNLTSINQPSLTINGVQIDASNSTFEISNGAVDISTFFSLLQIGMQLTIEDASYNSTTHILSFGNVELTEQETEDDPDDFSGSNTKTLTRDIFGTGGVGVATFTGSEVIFSSSFE
jgi:hypothetical protein